MTTSSVRRLPFPLLLAAGLAWLASPLVADPWRDDETRHEPATQDDSSSASSESSPPPSPEPSPPPPTPEPSPPPSPPEPAADDPPRDSGTGGYDGSSDSDPDIGKIPRGGGHGDHDPEVCPHDDHGHGGHGHGDHGHHDCDLGHDPSHDLGSAWGGSDDDTESEGPWASGLTALDTDVVPESAEIWIDGERRGSADDFDGFPDYLWLTPGPHDLLLYKPGYRTVVARIIVDHGVVNVLDDRMVKGPAMQPAEIFRSRGRR